MCMSVDRRAEGSGAAHSWKCSQKRSETWSKGWRERTGVRFLYLDNPGLIHDKEQDPLALLGVILENRASCKF